MSYVCINGDSGHVLVKEAYVAKTLPAQKAGAICVACINGVPEEVRIYEEENPQIVLYIFESARMKEGPELDMPDATDSLSVYGGFVFGLSSVDAHQYLSNAARRLDA